MARLRAEGKKGNHYSLVFSVDRKLARMAGWEPGDDLQLELLLSHAVALAPDGTRKPGPGHPDFDPEKVKVWNDELE